MLVFDALLDVLEAGHGVKYSMLYHFKSSLLDASHGRFCNQNQNILFLKGDECLTQWMSGC